MLDKSSLDRELARRICAAFVSHQLGVTVADAVQEHAGRRGGFVVLPCRFGKRVGEQQPEFVVRRPWDAWRQRSFNRVVARFCKGWFSLAQIRRRPLNRSALALCADLVNEMPPGVQLALRPEKRLQFEAAHFLLLVERRILLEARKQTRQRPCIASRKEGRVIGTQ